MPSGVKLAGKRAGRRIHPTMAREGTRVNQAQWNEHFGDCVGIILSQWLRRQPGHDLNRLEISDVDLVLASQAGDLTPDQLARMLNGEVPEAAIVAAFADRCSAV